MGTQKTGVAGVVGSPSEGTPSPTILGLVDPGSLDPLSQCSLDPSQDRWTPFLLATNDWQSSAAGLSLGSVMFLSWQAVLLLL